MFQLLEPEEFEGKEDAGGGGGLDSRPEWWSSQALIHEMKRKVSMLRLRRAAALAMGAGFYDKLGPAGDEFENRDVRGGPRGRVTMLRLRKSRQPSMLRLRRVTKMRLKKSEYPPSQFNDVSFHFLLP